MLRFKNKHMGEWGPIESIIGIIRTKVLLSCMIRHNLYNGKFSIFYTGRSTESHPDSASHSEFIPKLLMS